MFSVFNNLESPCTVVEEMNLLAAALSFLAFSCLGVN